jgi:hypothetical protein
MPDANFHSHSLKSGMEFIVFRAPDRSIRADYCPSCISRTMEYLISIFFIFILWHVDPLLGNDRELNNYTTVVNRKRPINGNRGKVSYVRSVPRNYKQDELRAGIR